MKGRRRRLVGKVTSNKMMKTVVVQVERHKRHPLYGKVVSKATKFMAHDELGAQMGDTVQIVESRPISRHKHWVVEAIVNRGYHVVLPEDEPETAIETGAAPTQPEAEAEAETPAGEAGPEGGAA